MDTAIVRQGYRIGSVALASGFDSATELVLMSRPARLPNSPPWLLGLINLHGYPIPLFDLAPLLATQHAPDATPMLLVVGRGDTMAALQIDGLPTRLRFSAGERLPVPEMAALLAGYVPCAYADTEGTIWLEFETGRFLEDLATMLGTRTEAGA